MSTPSILRSVKGVLATVVCGLSLTSCADLARTGNGPAFLIMESMSGAAGGSTTFTSNVLSDVASVSSVTVGGVTTQQFSVINDVGQATIRAEMKNQLSTTAPSAINSITLRRYHVEFRRTDGRNQQGVDVPYAFDGSTTATINIRSRATVAFDLVRHQAKLERPLITLRDAPDGTRGGLLFLDVIAEVTFYGSDQAGNEVSITGSLGIRFSDYADE